MTASNDTIIHETPKRFWSVLTNSRKRESLFSWLHPV